MGESLYFYFNIQKQSHISYIITFTINSNVKVIRYQLPCGCSSSSLIGCWVLYGYSSPNVIGGFAIVVILRNLTNFLFGKCRFCKMSNFFLHLKIAKSTHFPEDHHISNNFVGSFQKKKQKTYLLENFINLKSKAFQ